MNLQQARELVASIRAGLGDAPLRLDVAICPPFPYLFPMAKAAANSAIAVGAQDCHEEISGAFTGEVSAEMIAETGARYVILGHSERRRTIGHLEDDQMVNAKARAARRAGLTPIVCVGETLAERQAGRTLDVLTFQATAALIGATVGAVGELVIAYEPVWAIGTGQNATPEQAQEAHAHIRGTLRRAIGAVADAVRILYGGSVKPENTEALVRQPDVDGALVGGASLKADSFVGIIRAALAAAA